MCRQAMSKLLRPMYTSQSPTYLSAGVPKLSVFEAGAAPFDPFATALTEYWVPGVKALNMAYGVALVTVTGAPPTTGVAVKV